MTSTPSLLSSACLALLLSLSSACDDDGPEFSLLSDNILGGGVLLSLTSDGEDAVFVGGELQIDGSGKGIIAHYDGETLCVEETQTDHTLWWIHSARPDEWYAVGESGTILHEVGGVRSDESVPTGATLYGVWDSGNRVVAVGGDPFDTKEGEVWVKESGTWRLLAGQLPGVAFKVWNQWIVGDGIAYHLEGDTLVERFPPNNAKLLTVVGRNDDDVWAVGGTQIPTVLHWEGGAWKEIEANPFCASTGLNGVWTAPDESVWIAGFGGTMAEFSDTWSCPSIDNPPSFEHFHVVAKHQDEILWAGGNMFSQGNNYGTIGRFGKGKKSLTATTCP